MIKAPPKLSKEGKKIYSEVKQFKSRADMKKCLSNIFKVKYRMSQKPQTNLEFGKMISKAQKESYRTRK